MMRTEFERMAGGKAVTAEQYSVIETVYLYYPGEFTKEEVAALYRRHGIVFFYDLVNRARKVEYTEQVIAKARYELAILQTEPI
ncbi:MAG: hypothetical protein SCK57_08815 [Bacillota bacterium]|nr:hypothetical protein [Bacillota bacterium]